MAAGAGSAKNGAGAGGMLRRFWELVRGAGRVVAEAVYPQSCAGCGRWVAEASLCPTCEADIAALVEVPYCGNCGRTAATASVHDKHCGFCRTEFKQRKWNTAGIARVGPYAGTLRDMILALKFSGSRRVANVLADYLAGAIRSQPWGGKLEALVPVPMHWLKRLQRPAAHADVLAQAVGRRLGLPVVRAVTRSVHRSSQTRFPSPTERFENVRGCFAPRSPVSLRGKHVCIIDNIITSGATVHEVSKVLRKCGAKSISAAVAARTVIGRDRQAEWRAFLDEQPVTGSATAARAACDR